MYYPCNLQGSLYRGTGRSGSKEGWEREAYQRYSWQKKIAPFQKNERRYLMLCIFFYLFYSAFLPVTGFHLYCVGCPSTGIFPTQSGMDSCLCTFRHRLRRGGMLICEKSVSRQAVDCTPWKHSTRTELHSGRYQAEQLSQTIIFISLIYGFPTSCSMVIR